LPANFHDETFLLKKCFITWNATSATERSLYSRWEVKSHHSHTYWACILRWSWSERIGKPSICCFDIHLFLNLSIYLPI